MTERPTDPVTTERVRAMSTPLHGVEERLSHGEAAWFVRARQFATMSDHHHDDRLAIWLAAPAGRQESLVETDPGRFFRPPYVGHRGWVGVYLDVPDVDWTELASLIADAHRLVGGRGR
ncbi:MAG TPA: MmcQ/YjbR family DNA-binding protein [Candidatus Limnocylindrales bacterium]|nr:MmcQ/YjbR family DNA-binding protein [Candidatus Limnocylindrales bacterium]